MTYQIHDFTTERRPEPQALPSYDARELTAGGPLANIELDDKTYTLRITRQGKLILTK
ncbi:hemin uptake protein HemP [Paracoccaceae bacterium GXU_MW_L88]